jgi:hypothetical protein
VFVFLPGETHFAGVNFQEFRQRVGYKPGVAAVFQNAYQNVLAFAVRLKT